jgi:hypothetical protein
MRSPIVAILWETWRLTRVEAAWKLVFGIGGGLAVLALCAAFAPADNAKRYEDIMDNGAAIAMVLLVLPHLVSWLSLAKLNGGRPGFPLYLHYTRPVRTAVIVGLPMAFLTAVSSAVYLVSALLLRMISDYAFPLLPVAAWIAALTVVVLAATWSIRNRTFQMLVVAYAVMKGLDLAMRRLTAVEIPGGYDWPPRLWPTLFDFPLTDYAVIALIGLVSFLVTVAYVARQRHGDTGAMIPRAQGTGLWDRLVSLFPFPCPTSSATRAQVWFELRSNGLPVLTVGLALAIVILLLGAISNPIDAVITADFRAYVSCSQRGCFHARAMAALISTFSPLIVLLLGNNAFGIRRRQGRAYVSAFEAAQAYGSAQLTVLKLLVRSACVLAALIAVGVSVRISLLLLGDEVFIQMWNLPLNGQLRAMTGAVAALTGYEQLGLAIVTAAGIVIWVAAFAVLGALWTRNSRRMNIAASSLLLFGLALALLALAERNEIVPSFAVDAIFAAARWIFVTAIVFTTVYVCWSGFAERVLTARYVCVALVLSAVFGAAWLTMLHAADVQFTRVPATNFDAVLWPVLLLPLISVLAPWSLNRIRHI